MISTTYLLMLRMRMLCALNRVYCSAESSFFCSMPPSFWLVGLKFNFLPSFDEYDDEKVWISARYFDPSHRKNFNQAPKNI